MRPEIVFSDPSPTPSPTPIPQMPVSKDGASAQESVAALLTVLGLISIAVGVDVLAGGGWCLVISGIELVFLACVVMPKEQGGVIS